MNFLISPKELEQHIKNDKLYTIIFVYKGSIFQNNIEYIHNIEDNMKKYISEKLKKFNPIKKEIKFIRNMYFSQIRDKNENFERIYTTDYNYISEFKKTYTMYLIELDYKEYDKLTFPNLTKYHYTSNINKNILKIENISIIIENNNISIEFTNPNIDTLCEVINVINSIAS